MRQLIFAFFIMMFSLNAFGQRSLNKIWDFDHLDGWVYSAQDDNPDQQLSIENGILRIFTRANSLDRKKVHTKAPLYSSGRYTWRTYISDMKKGDQTSIGSWLYRDDHHELDFEVGYGNAEVRKKLGAGPSDMVAYMTSQDFPAQSVPVKIKAGWHLFAIDLKLVDGKYLCRWYIDKKLVSTAQLSYGDEYKFFIFCSVENLKFIGDSLPKQDNYGLFDFVKYQFHK